MKKTYINPEMEVIKVRMGQYIMAGSPANQVLDPSNPITDPNNIGAPEFDFWGE